uniref:SAM domain-containing protein n=1 Tax=Pyxicephalus adspersus TaxID=30357 RepID=A0AAV3BAU2_PYXAD|nr:TPA: hypothetical protein GDO54_001313 [Pyxicephalus adspersus]
MFQGPAADFDLMNALDWSNGIATLPGSDIRFRLSEFGTLEIITDSDTTVTPSNNQNQEKSNTSTTCLVPKQDEQSNTPSSVPTAPVASTENERPQRLRKKRKLLLDSGDEEDFIDEEEVVQDKVRSHQRGRKPSKQTKSAPTTKKKSWNWVSYLEEEKMPAAPLKLFKEHQSFPQSRNGFKVGYKLEGIDPEHPSLYCVLTTVEIQGYRIRLHFDGYPDCYDFWVNADSVDIHPVGWCEKTGHRLTPPKGYKDGEFSWPSYLKQCKCDSSSPYIRPVGHCKELGVPLTPPPEFKDPKTFSWETHLEKTGAQAAPARAFKVRPPHGFQPQMKLEAVDKRNPMLIRVCTIVEREENRIKLHFDNWSSLYDYWVDADSPDIHPVGWCAKTGHPLQLPPGVGDTATIPGQGCPIPGCKGIGHVRGPRYGTHYTAVGCPYSEVNLNRESLLQDRLIGDRPWPAYNPLKSRRPSTPNPTTDPQPDSPQSRKCPTPTDEQFGKGNMWEMAEWLEDEAEMKPQIKKGAHTYIRLQLIKQDTDGTDCELSLEQALHQSVFMTSLSPDPGHRIHLCWEQQCHLLPEVSAYSAKTVTKWTAEEVAQFVQQLPGCTEQASVFKEEQIDGVAFLLLTRNDLVKILGLKLGPALKIHNSILMFNNLEQN